MSDLTNSIMKTLGVVPAPTPKPKKLPALPDLDENGWAPERPEELYEYTYYVSKHGIVTATLTESEADDFDLDEDEIDWGYTEVNDHEQGICINQAEVDEWDELYSATHYSDGEPKDDGPAYDNYSDEPNSF